MADISIHLDDRYFDTSLWPIFRNILVTAILIHLNDRYFSQISGRNRPLISDFSTTQWTSSGISAGNLTPPSGWRGRHAHVPEPHNLACPDTSRQACAAPLNLGSPLNHSAALHPGAFSLRTPKHAR
jgi:hypothetical protein